MSNMIEDYPEEYVRGYVEFLWKKFHVNKDVLIPRLETEVLLKRARNLLTENNYLTVVDIWTGAGIIPVSLIKYTNARIVATDISPQALTVARENLHHHFPERHVEFIESDLLSHISPDIFHTLPLLITANLPYVCADERMIMSSDTRYEPPLALFGGDVSWFEIYERLFYELSQLRLRDTILLIEFGYDQHMHAESCFQKYGWDYRFFSDYAGIERFAEVSKF